MGGKKGKKGKSKGKGKDVSKGKCKKLHKGGKNDNGKEPQLAELAEPEEEFAAEDVEAEAESAGEEICPEEGEAEAEEAGEATVKDSAVDAMAEYPAERAARHGSYIRSMLSGSLLGARKRPGAPLARAGGATRTR